MIVPRRMAGSLAYPLTESLPACRRSLLPGKLENSLPAALEGRAKMRQAEMMGRLSPAAGRAVPNVLCRAAGKQIDCGQASLSITTAAWGLLFSPGYCRR